MPPVGFEPTISAGERLQADSVYFRVQMMEMESVFEKLIDLNNITLLSVSEDFMLNFITSRLQFIVILKSPPFILYIEPDESHPRTPTLLLY